MALDPISVGGEECVPWLYRPDGEILERLEWMTDVLQAFDGSEQRIALRDFPRRSFEFAIGLTGRERRTAENLLHAWQAGAFLLPIWMDSQAITAPLTAGATSIAIDTATRDFRIDGFAGIATGPLDFEIVRLSDVTSGALALDAPLTASWAVGPTYVFPLCVARLPADMRLQRFDGDTSYGRMQWSCVDANDWPAATGGDEYRGFPVLGQAPNWTEDVDQGFLRKLASLDPGTGKAYFDEEGSGALMAQSHRWLLDGRTEIDAFRRWCYARKGRLSAFWLPTFAQDFAVAANIGASSLTVDVEHCGYTDAIAQGIGRRDIRVQLHDGTVYLRRITNSAVVSAGVERLTINAALGAAVTPAAIRSVSYLDLVRLDADSVEISWVRWDLAESRLTTRGSRNDL